MTPPRIFPNTDNLTQKDFRNGVYDPDSDSFCLMDAIEKDVETILTSSPQIIFDFGSGSGILSAHFRLLLDTFERNNRKMSMFYCLDINTYATRVSLDTLRLNSVNSNCPTEAICCDIANPVSLKRFFGTADIILWNPPYVPSGEENSGDYACAGGADGTAFIRKMFPTAVGLLAPQGYLYMLLIEQNNPDKMAEFFCEAYSLRVEVVFRRLSGERYTILRFQKVE